MSDENKPNSPLAHPNYRHVSLSNFFIINSNKNVTLIKGPNIFFLWGQIIVISNLWMVQFYLSIFTFIKVRNR